MRIAIMGAGAVGGALAGFLDQAGRHEFTLCTRRPIPHLTATWPERVAHLNGRNKP